MTEKTYSHEFVRNNHAVPVDCDLYEPNGSKPATKKIALVAKAPSSVHLAPYSDPSWEIWTMGDAVQHYGLSRWDRQFELHELTAGFARWESKAPHYRAWLEKDHGIPLVVGASHPSVPHAEVYPWEEVFERFGRYHNSSVSLMIAFALLEGVTDLGLYGIDMATDDVPKAAAMAEYQHQRPSCEHILGIAQGLGVRIGIPKVSDLLKCQRVYAYQDKANDELRAQLERRRGEQNEMFNDAMDKSRWHKQQSDEMHRMGAYHQGARDDIDYTLRRLQ